MEEKKPSNEEEKVYIRENIVEPAKRKRYYVGKFFAYICIAIALGVALGGRYGFIRQYFSHKQKQSVEEETTEAKEQENIDKEQIQAFVESYAKEWVEKELEIDTNAEQLKQVYANLSDAIVSVNGIVQGSDEWFNDEVIQTRQTFGVVIQKSDTEILLLSNYNKLKGSSSISVEIFGKEREGKIKRIDGITEICCITLPANQFSLEELEKIMAIPMANSFGAEVGDSVIYAGSPMVYPKSVIYGNISYINKEVSVIDGRYRMLYTDQIALEGSEGILINEDGQLIGWIHKTDNLGQLKNVVSAIGISDLQSMIERLIKGESGAYLGVKGKDVTEAIAKEKGLSVGVYVTELIDEGPAYLCGIQKGDIITKVGEQTVKSLADLERILEEQKANGSISIEIARKGREETKIFTVAATLGQR